MENEGLLERERLRIEQILQLNHDELQYHDRDADHGQGGAETFAEINFDSSLPSLHTYLGEVEDVPHRTIFLDDGATLNLLILYLNGVVLFPEATLPLRVIRPNFIAAVERVLSDSDAPNTVGVIHISLESDNEIAYIGTIAEIRQFRRLEDGSLNLLTRGKQRFHLRRQWTDYEYDVPRGEVEIIQEDFPLRTPRDAFGDLIPRSTVQHHSLSCELASYTSGSKPRRPRDEQDDSASNSKESIERELSLREKKIHLAAIDFNESSSDKEISLSMSEHQHAISHLNVSDSLGSMHSDHEKENEITGFDIGKSSKSKSNMMHGFSRAFWPYWVYSMYDSYILAPKAAALWNQIVGIPNMDGFVKNPDILSFYIASKIPVYESTRQELLEMDGVSYRLRREIELLKSIDIIQCIRCQTVVGKHRDMLVMSSEGPLGAYVDPHSSVHEIITLCKANGLARIGRAETEFSWFPGYSRTFSMCANCENPLGWRFIATNRNLRPTSFWGLRSSQIADGTYY